MKGSVPLHNLDRRGFLGFFTTLGLTHTLFPGVLWTRIQEQPKEEQPPRITLEMIRAAEQIAGLSFTDEERKMMLDGLERYLNAYETIRTVPLANEVPPAFYYLPHIPQPRDGRVPDYPDFDPVSVSVPKRPEDLAYLPVTHLTVLLRERKVTSQELTELYLDRLQRYGPKLECVITLTEDRAREQARRADKEIAMGYYRGPLHGIPWGVKDLMATRGYRTTWGAKPFRDQVIDRDATVVKRLHEAGAVLVAKLTTGALAWGDVWFGGKTRNPWNRKQGSSGSSAGPAAATAAGLVAFALGTETWGSIVSPCTRCGCSGLRPTFGRVPRSGTMALSWTMDKIGPIARSVEDCALVFAAIVGPDGEDPAVVDRPFHWDPDLDLKRLRVGYVQSAFDADRKDKEWAEFDHATLETLKGMGLNLVPVELPDLPIAALSFILNAEAAAAFDVLTRTNRDDELVRQVKNAWPNVFRQSRFIPAVEYIQANRIRTLLLRAMAQIFQAVDLYVVPTYGANNLLLTNLTGHPSVVVPNGFRKDGTPTSITFVGNLYDEARLLAVARAYQRATDFHTRHPHL